MISIRPANDSEAPFLQGLAELSKDYWEYPTEYMDAWRRAGVFYVPPEQCRAGAVQVADDATRILGFYMLTADGYTAQLEDLWVEPTHIGSGERIGELLFRHAVDKATTDGRSMLRLDADPHAVGFYEKQGMYQTGITDPDPCLGRQLPILELHLPVSKSVSGSEA